MAVSGPGRGYEIQTGVSSYLLAGDETAIPAIDQLLEAMPPTLPVTVLIEVSDPAVRLELHAGPATTLRWLDLPEGAAPGTAMVEAIESLGAMPAVVWVGDLNRPTVGGDPVGDLAPCAAPAPFGRSLRRVQTLAPDPQRKPL